MRESEIELPVIELPDFLQDDDFEFTDAELKNWEWEDNGQSD